MVLRTPTKLDELRQVAAERRSASDVPASVLAAGTQATPAPAVAADLAAEGGELRDLFGDMQQHHDFDAWDGDTPPGAKIQAEVHAETEHANVTTRHVKKRSDNQLPLMLLGLALRTRMTLHLTVGIRRLTMSPTSHLRRPPLPTFLR